MATFTSTWVLTASTALIGRKRADHFRDIWAWGGLKSSIARRTAAAAGEEEANRQADAEERRGRGRPSHLRSLGSNAFRFEEREEAQDDAQQTQQEGDYGGRTQFFASEQNYREQMGAAPGEYFQSRAMKQWEEKDDAADDQAAVGVLDLDWIASQLALVPPDARYRIDPKYCIDLPFEPQDEEESGAEEEVASEQVNTAKTAAPVAAPSTAAPTPPKSAQGDAELDFLLNLSASTSTMAKSAPAPVAPAVTAPAPTRTPAETEQLEEWLDDVLDM